MTFNSILSLSILVVAIHFIITYIFKNNKLVVKISTIALVTVTIILLISLFMEAYHYYTN